MKTTIYEDYANSIKNKKLIDVLHPLNGHTDDNIEKMKDVRVLAYVDGCEIAWPGNHKYVMNWYILENEKIIGFNENPAIGWGYPVMGKKSWTKHSSQKTLKHIVDTLSQ